MTLDNDGLFLFLDLLIYELFSLIAMACVNNFPKLEKIFYGKMQWSVSSIESNI